MDSMSYKIRIPIKVHEQTMGIATYISEKLKSPQAAQNVLNDLYDAYSSLEEFPERIPFSRIKELRARGVRCMVVRKYLIYFQIDEPAKQVNVLAVLYGKRDQAAKMETIIEN